MRRALGFSSLALLTAVFMLGCATKPPAAPADAEPSSIKAQAAGLEPGADPQFAKIDFALKFGSADAIKTWKLSIDGKSGSVFTMNGEGGSLPATLSWDGKSSDGSPAPEGSYTASLAIDYGGHFNAGTAKSDTFVLVRNPPSATWSPNPGKIPQSPDGNLVALEITVKIDQGLAKIAGWSIEVLDPSGAHFATIKGLAGSGTATWDGKGDSGAFIKKGSDYPATLTVVDEFGGKGLVKGSFAVADQSGAPTASIAASSHGFSPQAQTKQPTINLIPNIPDPADVVTWEIDVMSDSLGLVKSWTGDTKSLPASVTWDGKNNSGEAAPQGVYTPKLSLTYGKLFKEQDVSGQAFSLALDAPSGSIDVVPQDPAISEISAAQPLAFTIKAVSAYAFIAKYSMDVVGPDGSTLKSFSANYPNNNVVKWDGTSGGTMVLQPGTHYQAIAKVEDEYGNVGTLRGYFITDPASSGIPLTIAPAWDGFAPKGDGTRLTMDFALSVDKPDAVKSWKVEMLDASGTAVKTFTGGTKLPSELSWDGTTDAKALAPEGRYNGRLTVDFGSQFTAATKISDPFVLALTKPAVKVSLSTATLSQAADGSIPKVAISVDASSPVAKLSDWSVVIKDPDGNSFSSLKGNWPAANVSWDGKSPSGDLAMSATDYTIDVKVRDVFGNIGEALATIGTDIFVQKTAEGYRINVWGIVFKPYTADYKNVPADRAKRNIETLDLLAKAFNKFPDYKIMLAGHAVMINWAYPEMGAAEQRVILIPLSEERAKAIAAALVARGVAANRLDTKGYGALNPIVPDSDLVNRWKNRRVEFLLIK
ncbi:MAG TPA: FlgD immunoglobulin-like domain containing protein [Rectinemataceae bacterium]|nr:FlgD immunoglobulin-like domain containing protein [Rectinemataceae bacterium]